MFALVESAFNVVDLGKMVNIIERRRSLPQRHDGLPDRLKKEIKESFHILDTNSDGLVSRGQVEDLVYRIDPDTTHEEMVDLLDTADLDADGMYDLDEYLFLMYLKWNDQESVTDIKEAFKVFDKDSSGALSREEFAYILRKLGEPLTNVEVDEILNHFDRDGSGEIDFDEFAYVMTGPHLDQKGGDAAGIPLSSHSMDRLSPLKRILATPVSRSPSQSDGSRPNTAGCRSSEEESSPLAGVYGRRIVNSAPAGKRDTIKFTKSGPDNAAGGRKGIRSAAELRPLGSARPLTGGKLVVSEKPKAKEMYADVVIERYHELYGQQTPRIKRKSDHVRERDPSLDSDNFSMCSDVIRDMNSNGGHCVPDSDVDDYV